MARVVDYDAIASQYDRRYEDQSYHGIERALLECLGGNEDLDVLEAGCGTGHWLQVLAPRVKRAVGIDPSAGMLARARRAVPDALLVQGRAEELAWAADSLDRVLCVNAFHHFGSRATFLAEARRVLRINGRLMIIGLDPHTRLDSWWVYDYFHGVLALDLKRYPSAAEIRAEMTEAGFRSCETIQAEHIVRRVAARAAIEGGVLNRSFTSQLTILPGQEYEEGLDRIRSAMDAAAVTGEDVVLTTDVRLYATTGSAA